MTTSRAAAFATVGGVLAVCLALPMEQPGCPLTPGAGVA